MLEVSRWGLVGDVAQRIAKAGEFDAFLLLIHPGARHFSDLVGNWEMELEKDSGCRPDSRKGKVVMARQVFAS